MSNIYASPCTHQHGNVLQSTRLKKESLIVYLCTWPRYFGKHSVFIFYFSWIVIYIACTFTGFACNSTHNCNLGEVFGLHSILRHTPVAWFERPKKKICEAFFGVVSSFANPPSNERFYTSSYPALLLFGKWSRRKSCLWQLQQSLLHLPVTWSVHEGLAVRGCLYLAVVAKTISL